MSRVKRYKLLYTCLIMVGIMLAGIVIKITDGNLSIIIPIILILLIPGRIAAYFWRDFYRGRRLLVQGQVEDAISYLDRFLDQVAARPGLKRLIWVNWAINSRDIEAMTHNNLGAAYMQSGKTDLARKHFEAAIRLDPMYPIPWFNLGIISKALGESDKADEAFKTSRRNGGHGEDQAAQATIGLRKILAETESRGHVD